MEYFGDVKRVPQPKASFSETEIIGWMLIAFLMGASFAVALLILFGAE